MKNHWHLKKTGKSHEPLRNRELHRTYIAVKPAKVNETRAGELSWLLMINTEEEVQCEGGDHRSKKLHKKTKQDKGLRHTTFGMERNRNCNLIKDL